MSIIDNLTKENSLVISFREDEKIKVRLQDKKGNRLPLSKSEINKVIKELKLRQKRGELKLLKHKL